MIIKERKGTLEIVYYLIRVLFIGLLLSVILISLAFFSKQEFNDSTEDLSLIAYRILDGPSGIAMRDPFGEPIRGTIDLSRINNNELTKAFITSRTAGVRENIYGVKLSLYDNYYSFMTDGEPLTTAYINKDLVLKRLSFAESGMKNIGDDKDHYLIIRRTVLIAPINKKKNNKNPSDKNNKEDSREEDKEEGKEGGEGTIKEGSEEESMGESKEESLLKGPIVEEETARLKIGFIKLEIIKSTK